MNENVKVYRILISIIFLLVMGVSQGWGQRYYQVVILPSDLSGTGYTVTSPNNRYMSVSKQESTYSSGEPLYYIYARSSNTNYYNTFQNNISTYVKPTAVSGYETMVEYYGSDGNPFYGVIYIYYYKPIGIANYSVVTNPSDLDNSGVTLNNTNITYSFRNKTYTSSIGGPYTWTSGEHEGETVYSVENVPSVGENYFPLYYPITNSNVNDYFTGKEIDGYDVSSISVAEVSSTGDYASYYNYCRRVIVVNYTPKSHTLYYKVQYNEGAPDGKGFSLKTNSLAHGTSLSANGTTITASTGNNSSYVPERITWKNVDDVISPTAVDGYLVKAIVSGGTGTQGDPYIITLNYYNNWVIDGLEYSTFHVESTGHQYTLPEGEVAVSLYLGGPVSGDISGDESLWEIVEITDTIAYAGGINGKGVQLTTTTGVTTSDVADDDGDAAGETASYKCLGQLAMDIPANEYVDENGNTRTSLTFSSDYFYERTHHVYVSKLQNVVIPATVSGAYGEGEYEVTAIQKFGFNYAATDQNDLMYCPMGDESNKIYIADNINDHRNDYLQSVTFEQPCNVRSIGDYAFMSCPLLKTFTVPYTVEYLGVGTFECSQKLETVLFQTNPDTNSADFGKTNLRSIQNWTFWYCTGLKSISLADGITRIEGQPSGSSFQYNAQLTYIRLPNTLQYIGPHFLCSATSIKTVTIPASVTYIDGACFHGCESLEKVYLLGEAAYLKADDGGSSRTFDYNETLCGDHVNNCEFFVPEDYIDEYQGDAVWCQIDEKGLSDGSIYTNAQGQTVKCEHGNKLSPMPSEERTFAADTWQTVIFPQRTSYNSQGPGIGVKNYKQVFGDETWVAELSEVHQDASDQRLYHLTFTPILGDDIPSGKPLLIKPERKTTFTMFDASDQVDPAFLLDMTDEHSYYKVAPEDGTIIYMKGCYMPETKLAMWDFYFTRVNGEYVFRKVPDTSFHRVSTATRCWWRFEYSGVPVDANGAKAFMSAIDDETTDINHIQQPRFVIDGVYDLNGRKISDVEFESHSHQKGIYVVNGKKVFIK